jgi:hypothetical protein
VEAGYNTSTVALRVVEGDEKRKRGDRRYNWAALSMGDIHTGTWSSMLEFGHKAGDFAA